MITRDTLVQFDPKSHWLVQQNGEYQAVDKASYKASLSYKARFLHFVGLGNDTLTGVTQAVSKLSEELLGEVALVSSNAEKLPRNLEELKYNYDANLAAACKVDQHFKVLKKVQVAIQKQAHGSLRRGFAAVCRLLITPFSSLKVEDFAPLNVEAINDLVENLSDETAEKIYNGVDGRGILVGKSSIQGKELSVYAKLPTSQRSFDLLKSSLIEGVVFNIFDGEKVIGKVTVIRQWKDKEGHAYSDDHLLAKVPDEISKESRIYVKHIDEYSDDEVGYRLHQIAVEMMKNHRCEDSYLSYHDEHRFMACAMGFDLQREEGKAEFEAMRESFLSKERPKTLTVVRRGGTSFSWIKPTNEAWVYPNGDLAKQRVSWDAIIEKERILDPQKTVFPTHAGASVERPLPLERSEVELHAEKLLQEPELLETLRAELPEEIFIQVEKLYNYQRISRLWIEEFKNNLN